MLEHNPSAPIVLEDRPDYWVLFKPAGWFVHPPSDTRAKKQFAQFILTSWFMRELGQKAFPIHRLDFGTEGVMIWAKTATAASLFNELHGSENLQKTYRAVVRGHTPDQGVIDVPLLSDSSPQEVACRTEYTTRARIELPAQINSPHATSRYSLVEVKLKTGRWHQIRRHFNRVSHPIMGDREHGDSHHNRFFRDHLQIPGLLLQAQKLEFTCPFAGCPETLQAPENERWNKIHGLFNP
jgi:tRNA pseudouridine65 synthase